MALILVVEDDLSIRHLIRTALEEQHTIIEAGTGREGLALALYKCPDAVILDIGLSDDITGMHICLLYTSPSPRDRQKSRMPSSA